MFFDPRPSGAEVAVSGEPWQSRRAPAARRPATHDFLSLPAIGSDVQTRAVMRWNAEKDVASLICAQFNSGVLRTRDVPGFKGAGDALANGFFAWAKRHTPRMHCLGFNFVLCDVQVVLEAVQYQGDRSDFNPTSPVYLGIETAEENIFEIGRRAAELRSVHPRLVSTALVLINRAAGRTMWVRTPDEFLGEFASWFWDGDPQATDKEAREMLTDRFGEDEAEIEHYLPSVVRPQLCPDDMDVCRWHAKSRRYLPQRALGVAALRRLQRFTSGRTRRICAELEKLSLMLQRVGNRDLFGCEYRPQCAYAAATLTVQNDSRVGEVLDSHYEHLASAGDGATYYGFTPLASTPEAIRNQYANWSQGLSILGQLDRVIACLAA
ncbi:PRTRC system protein F [Caballeronia sp. EK]|uniref:PRTRC system protein F n=1 Tax=Caballeronia sp. EK TaxID=2767469 RepID=UPI001655D42E|nr:PRTRC system protein F [Caballeronia sp. EK]MBC8640759.1 PRTRC system protein F [Caballeronia sp. EK]